MAKPRDSQLARTLMVLVAKLMHAQAELLDYRLDPATEPPASKHPPSPPFPAMHPLLIVAGHGLEAAAGLTRAFGYRRSPTPCRCRTTKRSCYPCCNTFPAACAELERWVYAKGIKLRGLVKRRAAERAMCEGR